MEHDLVLGHGEGDAVGEAVDGALEVVVGERLHVAAAIADHVVMVVAVGPGSVCTVNSARTVNSAPQIGLHRQPIVRPAKAVMAAPRRPASSRNCDITMGRVFADEARI